MTPESSLYLPDQSASTLPQGTSGVETPFDTDLYAKAQERLEKNFDTLRRISQGELPHLNSGKAHGAKWLRALIATRIESGHLSGRATDYYRLVSREPVMGYNPVPYQLVEATSELDAVFNPLGITVRVLGTAPQLDDNEIKTAQEGSDTLIALPGGLKAALELTDILREKLKGNTLLPPLVIENINNSQVALLANYQLAECTPNDESNIYSDHISLLNLDGLAAHYGIYITRSRVETITVVRELYAARHPVSPFKALQASSSTPLIKEGDTIFLATATIKKYSELKSVFETLGLKVNILPIDRLVDGYTPPKEKSNSYEGNAAEKIEAAFAAWEKMDIFARADRLKELGERLHAMGYKDTDTPLKLEDMHFASEDSGFRFRHRGIQKALEFSDTSHVIDPEADFPEVETGPVALGNSGPQEFFERAESVLLQQEAKGIPITREVINTSIIAVARLQSPPDTYDAHFRRNRKKIIMYMGRTTGETFQTTPQPIDGPREFANFLRPAGSEKTEAELGDEWTNYSSPRALAARALVMDQKIPGCPQLSPRPLREAHFEVNIVADTSHTEAQKTIDSLLPHHRKQEFCASHVCATIERLSDVQTKMLEGKDAVVLAFNPDTAQEDFWRNVWIFSSLIVAEQTHDKYKLSKPLYLINPKDNEGCGVFDYLEDITTYLHEVGTIAQDPYTLYKSVPSIKDAIDGLKTDRNNYFRYSPPSYSRNPHRFKPSGKKPSKDFNVAIFISASVENQNIHDVGNDLAGKLATESFGVFSGGGLYSGMGAITKTCLELRNKDSKIEHAAWNAPHIMDAGEVGDQDIREKVSYFQLCRHIYERIEGLLTADAVIVAPGGMGTIQELAGFALLKKTAIDNPDNIELQSFLHKELVILNTPISGKNHGFYDTLVHIIPENDFHRLGLHVLDTPDKAMAKIRDLRDNKQNRTTMQSQSSIGMGI